MAEGGNTEQRTTSHRNLFYCHMCNTEIFLFGNDHVCPHCSNGFIEELQPRLSSVDLISLSISEDYASPSQNNSGIGNLSELEDVGVDFFGALSSGNIGMDSHAWGLEGIPSIVNRFLNRGTNLYGVPPLPKDRIKEISRVKITDDDIARKLKCSVCLEDFVIGEDVRQLLCFHLFHDNCLIPWLEMHGTCPMCRKILQSANRVHNSVFSGTSTFLSASEALTPGGPEVLNVTLTESGAQSTIGEGANRNEQQEISSSEQPQGSNVDSHVQQGARFVLSGYNMSFEDGNIDYEVD